MLFNLPSVVLIKQQLIASNDVVPDQYTALDCIRHVPALAVVVRESQFERKSRYAAPVTLASNPALVSHLSQFGKGAASASTSVRPCKPFATRIDVASIPEVS